MTTMPPDVNDAKLPAWDRSDLAALLTLKPNGSHDRLRTTTTHDVNRNDRVFGGQLLAQLTAAALVGVGQGRVAASVQALFLRSANVDEPIDYEVSTLQDGRRYAGRQVTGLQGRQRVISAQVSTVSAPDSGVDYASQPLDVPPPDDLLRNEDLPPWIHERMGTTNFRLIGKPAIEMRLVDPTRQLFPGPGPARLQVWLRVRNRLPDHPAAHAAALAYLSDYWLTMPATAYRMLTRPTYIASVSHSMWFLMPCRADEWLLFDSHGVDLGVRALARSRVYTRDGREVMALAQECAVADRTPFTSTP